MEGDHLEAVGGLAERFTIPLEGAVANPTEIHSEFLDIMQ